MYTCPVIQIIRADRKSQVLAYLGCSQTDNNLEKTFRNLSRLIIHSVIFIWDRFQFNCANQCCTSLLNRFSFVWNRTKSVFADSSEIPASAVLEDLSKCAERSPDVIVEVAHPSITKEVYRIESYLVEQSSTRCVGWSVTWVGLTLIWMFHHLAQQHSPFCQIPICQSRAWPECPNSKSTQPV